MKDQIITNDDDFIDKLIEVKENVRGDLSSFYTNGWQDWNRKWNMRVNMIMYSDDECALAGVADFRSLLSDHKIGWTDLINIILYYICFSSKYVCEHLHFDGSGLQATHPASITRMIRNLFCDVSTWMRWQHWDPYRSCYHPQDQGCILLVDHVLHSQQEFHGFHSS
jgi:hypothetical protein